MLPCGMVLVVMALLPDPVAAPAAEAVSFRPSAESVELYDAFEVAIEVAQPTASNPFRDVSVTGEWTIEGTAPVRVEGFCDSPDGSVYRIRFMPTRAGRYAYTVTFRQAETSIAHQGEFTARASDRSGPIRVDPEHPWHFVVEGTGAHFFWNGTTTYFLLGWEDEAVIRAAIDRLAQLGVNRIRVALCGRTTDGRRWDEPKVVNTSSFRFRLNPWVAERPDSVEDPGFDVERFNVPFWRKAERTVRYARDKGVVVSILFFLDGEDPGVDPFGKARAGCDEETRYYHYAVARLAAFPNLMWDVTNEYHLFRTEPWVEQRGQLLKQIDPYRHLTSVHGHGDYRFRASPWSDFAMYQSWDEAGGHAFMLRARAAQAATGRPIPQINEEYGYEDTYPTRWGGGKKAPARSADTRRRLAWGICIAGGYQTTGERADQGTGTPPDTGGGWINGRGDDSMKMLVGYAHLVACFRSLAWWRLDPHDELVSDGAFCLAEPGREYLIYLPDGGRTTLTLAEGAYRARRFNPRTGEWRELGPVSGPAWTTEATDPGGDWAFALVADETR